MPRNTGLRAMQAERRKRWLAEHGIDEFEGERRDPGYTKRFCKYCGREIRFIYRDNKWLPRETAGGPHLCR